MSISPKTYSEVYKVLSLMPINVLIKIPDNILKNIEKNRDKEEIIVIESIEEYKPSDEAGKVISVLYKNYLATDEEKKIIEDKEKMLYQKQQEELRKKYNPDNLFASKTSEQKVIKNDTEIVESKDSIFKKIKKWIIRTFKKINCKIFNLGQKSVDIEVVNVLQ